MRDICQQINKDFYADLSGIESRGNFRDVVPIEYNIVEVTLKYRMVKKSVNRDKLFTRCVKSNC
jgi:hypothetical protein